jgi:hypothetical protein
MAEGDKIGREVIREEEETNFEMKDFNAKNRISFCQKSPDLQKDVCVTIDMTTIPV